MSKDPDRDLCLSLCLGGRRFGRIRLNRLEWEWVRTRPPAEALRMILGKDPGLDPAAVAVFLDGIRDGHYFVEQTKEDENGESDF